MKIENMTLELKYVGREKEIYVVHLQHKTTYILNGKSSIQIRGNCHQFYLDHNLRVNNIWRQTNPNLSELIEEGPKILGVDLRLMHHVH